ncbi:MAG: S-ribosylhomocysteine lyase [Clostridia bacterium]|nr:S-ribosylhomocysteine lyase [Clostridia bacterium]MBR4458166.1 S-ribosylhomocysteine lyase [Clostridia bacterium]
MRKIASFTVNHDTLTPGLYVSRIDGDCVTYDLRMKKPNGGDYLGQGALHTLEHLLATFIRSSDDSDAVIYVGPMGCRTGFYLIMRDSVSRRRVLEICREAFAFAADFTGSIPGARRTECGNYRAHDLEGARREAAAYAKVLDACSESTFAY